MREKLCKYAKREDGFENRRDRKQTTCDASQSNADDIDSIKA